MDEHYLEIVQSNSVKNKDYYVRIKPALQQLYGREYVVIAQEQLRFHSPSKRACIKFIVSDLTPEERIGHYLVRIGDENVIRFQGAVLRGVVLQDDDDADVPFGVHFPVGLRASGQRNFHAISMLADTGASDSWVSDETTEELKCPPSTSLAPYSTLSSTVAQAPIHYVDMRIGNLSVSFTVFGSGRNGLDILGNDYLKYHTIALNQLSDDPAANTLTVSREGRTLLAAEEEEEKKSATSSISTHARRVVRAAEEGI